MTYFQLVNRDLKLVCMKLDSKFARATLNFKSMISKMVSLIKLPLDSCMEGSVMSSNEGIPVPRMPTVNPAVEVT